MYTILLALLAGVVLWLSVKKTIDLFFRCDGRHDSPSRGLDAILFRGSVSAVLGLLGQFTAGHLSLTAIRRAGLLDPELLAEGIALSLVTTLFGLGILIFSALVWFGLHCRLSRILENQASVVSQ